MYELSTEEYNKLLLENSKTYKKTTVSAINAINTEAKAIAKDLNLDERIEQHSQNQSFITLKVHKENFQSNPKCRLINSAKSEIGIVRKHHIDQINKPIREKLNVNQWRDTQAVMAWFKNIKSKSNSSFIKFDIVNFYPSISKELLLKVINFAKSVFTKALLFNENDVYVKKENPDFDVTMGSYDRAEVCELVGLYILDILTKEFGRNKIGLYRDDGSGCF